MEGSDVSLGQQLLLVKFDVGAFQTASRWRTFGLCPWRVLNYHLAVSVKCQGKCLVHVVGISCRFGCFS